MSVADLERISRPSLPLRAGGSWSRRARLALIVAWRAPELDRQLAAGAAADDGGPLAIRGRRLTGRRYRVRVASGLARVLRDAEPGAAGFSAAVRPDRREVIAARTVLATLERRLRAADSVTAQGVVLLDSLLTDCTSALYRPAEPGALASELRAAAAALEPPGRYGRARVGQGSMR